MADTLQKEPTAKVLRDNLSAWDAKTGPKAKLTEKQKDTFIDLTTVSSNRALPVELPLEEYPLAVPHLVGKLPKNDPLSEVFTELNINKVQNTQQFFTWFTCMEEQMQSDSHIAQSNFVDTLSSYRDECDGILTEVGCALDYLYELKTKYVNVSTKTNALHDACEHLLAEQTKLVNTAESINTKLSYFNELDRISSKLGSPTLTVTNESFVPMLSRLDDCIIYLEKNPQYKESTLYMAKFKQCLSRALNFIRTHVITILQEATQNILPQKPDNIYNIGVSDDANYNAAPAVEVDAFTLFYGKFRTNAPRIRSLMEQIEQRVTLATEYEQLLSDCHQCYFNQRLTLLGPSVTSAVNDLATKHIRDQCALVRSGCAFMVHVCEDEYQLFFRFFTKHTPELESMLESLCNNLYDVLRPLIIHVNHLETLAELCGIMKREMLEDHVRNNPQQLAAFEAICSQMLEDVQERLVYRTHIYIRSEILHYAPAQGDLAYPEKLHMMESIAESLREKISRPPSVLSNNSLETENTSMNGFDTSDEKHLFVTVPLSDSSVGSVATNMPQSPADLHGMWYPTVRRTLVCLSKLYRCIDKTTFQGLSQETLSMCIHSLVIACQGIQQRSTVMDGQLFLIKHLLILREQIAPFHVDFAIKEMQLDFTKIKDAAYSFLSNGKQVFSLKSNNAVLQFLLDGTPQVTETFLDSKKDVDNQLKISCEDFIKDVSEQFVGPLKSFLSKTSVILQMSQEENGPKVQLRQQPFASSEKLGDIISLTYKNLKQKKPLVQRAMALYLANKDTEYILFKPIKGNVQQCFQDTLQILSDHYTEEDQQIVGAPSIEQVNLLLSSILPSGAP